MTTSADAPAQASARASAQALAQGPPKPMYPLGWLRGMAALSVVTFHAYQHNRVLPTWEWPWSGPAHQIMLGSDLFVDMFFVLSGLVLWLPVARSAEAGVAPRSGRALLYRRMARLLPLYLVLVLVVWTLTNPTLPGHWQDLVMHLTFTHIYSDTYIFWTNGPAWSLAVEFHFYVVMAMAVPFVAAGVRRARTRTGRLLVVSVLPAVCVVIGLAYLGWATLSGQATTNWSIWFSAPAKAADFGLGMGLAVLAAAGVRLGQVARGLLAAAGIGGLVWLVMVRPMTEVGESWHPLYALAITVALASVVLHPGPWPAWMSWKPLAWIGGLGYGIYLIHEPVMRMLGDLGALPEARTGNFFLITAALVIIPSTALAWVSSKTIEAAGQRLVATMDRNGRRRDYYEHLHADASPTPARAGLVLVSPVAPAVTAAGPVAGVVAP